MKPEGLLQLSRRQRFLVYDGTYLLGRAFSKRFLEILEAEYNKPKIRNKLWEDIYIEHIEELSMKTRKI